MCTITCKRLGQVTTSLTALSYFSFAKKCQSTYLNLRYKAEGKEMAAAAVELLHLLKGKGWQALCCVNICALRSVLIGLKCKAMLTA